MHSKCFPVAAGLFALTLYFCEPPVQAVNVLTQHNDNSRTGANTSETILTLANVNSSTFGPRFTNNVDGNVYAQPLFVQGMTISGGTHNVVFAATENNTVYAFDADSGSTYWTNHLVGSLSSGCGDTSPKVGITGTPVIDLTRGALYVDTRLGSTAGHQLHAVNITNGTEMFGGPVNVTNTGFGTSEHQRPGLLELSNVIYVAYGSQCDAGTYHGFVIGFNASTLAQLYSFNTSPNGSQAAIWSSGMGPVADASGNIYVMTGNGTYDGSTNNDYGMSMIKLSSTLALLDWATPSDYANLNGLDQDFGSGGAVLLPGGRLIGEGKDGIVHVANTSSMGHLNSFAQSFAGPNGGDVAGPSPVYWAGSGTNFIYYEHGNTSTYWYSYNGTTVNTTPLGSNSVSEADSGGGISLSANGTTNGILWSTDSDNKLRAYDAQHFPTLLWSGSEGTYQKMTCPTIANGKVYVGTSSTLIVFGLNNAPPTITSQPANQTKNVGQTATFSVSASGSPTLAYQWKVQSSGSYVNLSNVGQYSGATSTTLSISSVALTNATNYEVVVTNAFGSVTSSAALLTVLTNSSTNSYQTVILADHPAAYWPMQETTGPTIQDIAGGSFNGTLMTSTDGTSLGLNRHTNFATAGSVSTDGATYHLGLAGGLTGVSGDKAIYFTNLNGQANNSQIVVPYSATLDPASTFSAEAWIKLPTYPIGYTNDNYQAALGLEANGGAQNGWFMATLVDNSGGAGDFYFNLAKPPGSGWTSPQTSTSLGGTWVYAVEVCNGGTSLTCYTNGVQMSTVTWTTNNYESEGVYGLHKLPFVIGSYCASYNTGTNILTGFERGNFWHGAVSHVAIYTNALTTSQITNHYYFATNPAAASPSYQSTILADSPTAFWPLNETSGTVIHDVAGTNNGTVVNASGVTLGGQGVNYAHNTNSKAIYFINTNSGYISVPYNAAFQSANLSVELWLNMPTFPAAAQSANENPIGFCNGISALGWTFDIQVANTANPHMYAWLGKTGSWNSANTGVALQSQWSYYAMTFDGSTLNAYTNGVFAASAAVTTYSMVSSGNFLYMGDYNDGGNTPDTNRYYQGGMSQVAVYNYALTGSQVANHYTAGTNFSSGGGAEFKSPVGPAFKPTIGATLTPALSSGSSAKQFQMQVSAAANQNYTLQMSTDLSSGNWVSLYTTNSTTNTTFVLTDPNAATNKQRFYRVLVGP